MILLFSVLPFGCKPAAKSGEMLTPKEEIEQEVEIPAETRMSTAFILGTWQNIDQKDINFFLHLNIDQDFVVGEYCSKALEFFFEDCSLEDEGSYCSVRGPMNSINIEIEMESCINAEIGKGEIQRQDSIIILTLVEPAGEYGKDHLVPKKVMLKKISNEPFL